MEETKPAESKPVENGKNYAGFGYRLLAYGVDFFILFLSGFLLQYALGIDPFAVFKAQTFQELQLLQSQQNQSLNFSIGIFIAAVYHIAFWMFFEGATPGKKLLAIKISNDDGSNLSFAKAGIRYICFTLLLIVSFFTFWLGFLWIIWDKNKQGLHDKLAKTIVVKTDKKPQILLAAVITIVGLVLLFGYLTGAFVKGITLGVNEAQKRQELKEQQNQPVLVVPQTQEDEYNYSDQPVVTVTEDGSVRVETQGGSVKVNINNNTQ